MRKLSARRAPQASRNLCRRPPVGMNMNGFTLQCDPPGQAGAVHLQRGKYGVAQEFSKRLAGAFCDDHSEHHIAGVAVLPLCARREFPMKLHRRFTLEILEE